MKQKLVVLAFAFILCAAYAPVVAASSKPVEAAPTLQESAPYSCNVTTSHLFSGRDPNTSTLETSVMAYINPSQTFEPCAVAAFGGEKAVSAWVAIVPGSGNSHASDETAIVQVGVIADKLCTGFACQSLNNFFMAVGGCGGAVPTAQIFDSTIHNHYFGNWYDNHRYRVETAPTYFVLFIDDIIVFDSRTEGQASKATCWLDEPLDIMIVGEKSDHGDKFSGTGATDFTRFTDMERKYSGAWHALTSTTCEDRNPTTPHPDGCLISADGTDMNLWTN